MADYPLPPWLTPRTDPAQAFVTSMHLGAQIAQQQNQLQAEQERAQMETQARQQALQQQTLRAQQQIEMQRAYHDAVVGLRQDQLDQVSQANQLKAQVAARKFAAQQQFRQRVAAGEPASKVMMELGPEMGASAGDFGAALRQGEPQKDYGAITLQDLGSGVRAAFRKGSPGMHLILPQKQPQDISPTALVSLAKAVPDLESDARRLGTNSISAKVLDRIKPLLDKATGRKYATMRWNPLTKKPEKIIATVPADQAPSAWGTSPLGEGTDVDTGEE